MCLYGSTGRVNRRFDSLDQRWDLDQRLALLHDSIMVLLHQRVDEVIDEGDEVRGQVKRLRDLDRVLLLRHEVAAVEAVHDRPHERISERGRRPRRRWIRGACHP